MRNEVGRPTKYSEDVQNKSDWYATNWQEVGDVVPSRVGLCHYLGIHKSTSYDWEQSHPDFSDTLKRVETIQEKVALNGGMSGDFNSTITKLVLANHGYSDKQSVDHTTNGKDVAPLVVVLDKDDED